MRKFLFYAGAVFVLVVLQAGWIRAATAQGTGDIYIPIVFKNFNPGLATPTPPPTGQTPSPAASETPAPTETGTPTIQPSGTPFPIQSPTYTGTSTATGTSTTTTTPIPTATQTSTPTSTATFTQTPTFTPTPSPTPDCGLLLVEDIFASGDDVIASVRNNEQAPFYLTSSTLDWPALLESNGGLDPDVYVNWFNFNGVRYYSGDSYISPTTADPSPPGVQINPNQTADWRTDFGNYAAPLTLGQPVTVTLAFEPGGCLLSAALNPVEVEIVNPASDGLHLLTRAETRFEAEGWDTGVGMANGDGVRRVLFQLFDPDLTRILNRSEYLPRYCTFGDDGTDCSVMGPALWNSLVTGTHTLQARTEAGSGVWSPFAFRTFTVQPPGGPYEIVLPVTHTITHTTRYTVTNLGLLSTTLVHRFFDGGYPLGAFTHIFTDTLAAAESRVYTSTGITGPPLGFAGDVAVSAAQPIAGISSTTENLRPVGKAGDRTLARASLPLNRNRTDIFLGQHWEAAWRRVGLPTEDQNY